MAIRKLGILAAFAVMIAAPASAAPASIAGKWKTEDGRAVVTFYECGANMCGRISRFLVPEPAGGARDTENPNRELRNRELMDLRIFWGLSADGSSWEGEGYSPEDGRYFDAEVSRDGNRLKIRGCVLLFCRTQTWTRA